MGPFIDVLILFSPATGQAFGALAYGLQKKNNQTQFKALKLFFVLTSSERKPDRDLRATEK